MKWCSTILVDYFLYLKDFKTSWKLHHDSRIFLRVQHVSKTPSGFQKFSEVSRSPLETPRRISSTSINPCLVKEDFWWSEIIFCFVCIWAIVFSFRHLFCYFYLFSVHKIWNSHYCNNKLFPNKYWFLASKWQRTHSSCKCMITF